MWIEDDRPDLHPDEPAVLTVYVPYGSPGRAVREQVVEARSELLAAPFRSLELAVRRQLATLFGEAGLDPARDVAGIVTNRWVTPTWSLRRAPSSGSTAPLRRPRSSAVRLVASPSPTPSSGDTRRGGGPWPKAAGRSARASEPDRLPAPPVLGRARRGTRVPRRRGSENCGCPAGSWCINCG